LHRRSGTPDAPTEDPGGGPVDRTGTNRMQRRVTPAALLLTAFLTLTGWRCRHRQRRWQPHRQFRPPHPRRQDAQTLTDPLEGSRTAAAGCQTFTVEAAGKKLTTETTPVDAATLTGIKGNLAATAVKAGPAVTQEASAVGETATGWPAPTSGAGCPDAPGALVLPEVRPQPTRSHNGRSQCLDAAPESAVGGHHQH
jgi:hypothetical protein